MKEPGARWSAIAGFGIASGIGETIWRERVEREEEERRVDWPSVSPYSRL